VPAESHVEKPVQSPPPQIVPLAAGGLEQRPVDWSHVPAVWQASDAVHVTGAPPQMPNVQTSFVVQALPSEQLVPFAATGFEQSPVD
jgi:hypothetical protein